MLSECFRDVGKAMVNGETALIIISLCRLAPRVELTFLEIGTRAIDSLTLSSTALTRPKSRYAPSLPRYFIISTQSSTQVSVEAVQCRRPSSHTLCVVRSCGLVVDERARRYKDKICGGRACDVDANIERRRSSCSMSNNTFVADLPT